ncbi:MAG: hypothetical protein ACM33U_00005, partial [Solirubrobacterales bacterium]
MKKLAAAVAFAFALSAAGTAFAAGGGPKATGGAGFSQDGNPYHIGFNAKNHNKKKHKPDRGHVNLVDLAPTDPTGPGFVPDGSFTGKVTCYHQEAKEAWFSGAIDNPIPVPGTAEGELGFFL